MATNSIQMITNLYIYFQLCVLTAIVLYKSGGKIGFLVRVSRIRIKVSVVRWL